MSGNITYYIYFSFFLFVMPLRYLCILYPLFQTKSTEINSKLRNVVTKKKMYVFLFGKLLTECKGLTKREKINIINLLSSKNSLFIVCSLKGPVQHAGEFMCHFIFSLCRYEI